MYFAFFFLSVLQVIQINKYIGGTLLCFPPPSPPPPITVKSASWQMIFAYLYICLFGGGQKLRNILCQMSHLAQRCAPKNVRINKLFTIMQISMENIRSGSDCSVDN
jgi:hypothetical protein